MTLKYDRQAWIDAVLTIHKDPDVVVRCPVCQQADLEAMDVFPKSIAPAGGRYVFCTACEAHSEIRCGSRPPKMAAKLIED